MKIEKINTIYSTNGQNATCGIPKIFQEALGLKPGCKVTVTLDVENEQLIIKEIK